MKKTLILLAMGASLVLSACSKSGSDSSNQSVPIPGELTFTPEKGRPLSQTEINSISSLVKEIAAANNADITMTLPELLVPKHDESDSEKQKREDEIAKLSDGQRQELEFAKENCNIQPDTANITGNLEKAGDVQKTIASSSMTGAKCPVQYQQNSAGTVTLTSGTNGPMVNASANVSQVSENSSIRTGTAAPKTLISQHTKMSIVGSTQVSDESSKIYMTGNILFEAKLAELGDVTMNSRMQMLSSFSEEKTSSKVVIQGDLKVGDETYKLSMQVLANPQGEAPTVEFYLNGTKFDVSDLAKP